MALQVAQDLGVHPGSTATGFPPGVVLGEIHLADAVALQAKNDLTTAYNDAAGRTPFTNLPAELGGLTLTEGVYRIGAAQLTGTLTLDAQNNPAAVFIFQIASTLTTASNSSVVLVNGASACNVYWQVGSSATLGTGTDFVGNILAQTSITLNTGADLQGRALAQTGRGGDPGHQRHHRAGPRPAEPVAPAPPPRPGSPRVRRRPPRPGSRPEPPRGSRPEPRRGSRRARRRARRPGGPPAR
ncbi:ice-binding family protein [Plantactinospora sp. CA-290183]|uniref:ice-binding family protein n=1 Tax=Plantactinospora sp. CA-290183 TaxID=3240006 RepID=UPI003D8FC8A6